MQNYIQPGKQVEVVLPADVVSGGIVELGSLIGVAHGNGANGETHTVSFEGVFDLPKKSADVVTAGASLYYDDAEDELTTTATDNVFAGHAMADAGNGDVIVRTRLAN